jgi:hypothetical protein
VVGDPVLRSFVEGFGINVRMVCISAVRVSFSDDGAEGDYSNLVNTILQHVCTWVCYVDEVWNKLMHGKHMRGDHFPLVRWFVFEGLRSCVGLREARSVYLWTHNCVVYMVSTLPEEHVEE